MSDSATSPIEPVLGGVEFRDAAAAAANLARISARVPVGVRRALVSLLADSPDPDSALNLFERLCESGGPELFRLFDRHHFLLHYVLVVFGYSKYLGETLIQNTDLLQALLREKSLDLSRSREELQEAFARFAARSLETDISLLLARFKRREYVRIMLRDVLGIATLAETTAEISALTDVLIEEALRVADSELRTRYGPPQHTGQDGRLVDTPFTVLALGKLGGNELNYSSDIDLLYIYGDGEEPPAATISNREYFIRLAQHLTDILSRTTREGAPFRIDLRLRPQGAEGEPAIALSQALRYYSQVAHDWELQAMIKLRHSAGNARLGREFIRRVQPYVYTEQLNFAAIETALETREKIGRHRAFSRAIGTARSIDVKLDRGGIRDIEFLVQCLQRVYGGSELWLRSGGTLFSLQKLHDKAHISGKEFHDLTTAYNFLRTLEHRLQIRNGQQTHRLPDSASELRVLARMMTGDPHAEPEQMLDSLRERMAAVAAIYNRIIHHQQLQQQREDLDLPVEAHNSREEAHRKLMERVALDSEPLYQLIQRKDLDVVARRNLYRFLNSSLTSPERYAAVTEAPGAVESALAVFAVSDYLTDILTRHPEEIATLARIANAGPEAGTSDGAGAALLAADSHGEKLARLRRLYRSRIFASGVRDILQLRKVYASLEETTAAADAAITAALAIANEEVCGATEAEDEAPAGGFAILALGRLGSREADLLSDADLIFVREEDSDARPMTKLAERLMEALSAYTRDGTVFPVDARLRPHGAEGELVMTPKQLQAYFCKEAQAWEALTYTKLRWVAGSAGVGEKALAAARQLLDRFAAQESFAAAVREMRLKLERADEPANFKTGAGGIYDIDFLLSFLLIRHCPGNFGGTLRDRLRALAVQGALPKEDCELLDRSAELFRTVDHVIRLVTGRRRNTLPVAGQPRDAVELLASIILKRSFPDGLQTELERTFSVVRATYDRLTKATGRA